MEKKKKFRQKQKQKISFRTLIYVTGGGILMGSFLLIYQLQSNKTQAAHGPLKAVYVNDQVFTNEFTVNEPEINKEAPQKNTIHLKTRKTVNRP